MSKRKHIHIYCLLQIKLVIFLTTSVLAVAQESSNYLFASELGALYGISEKEAITRLAREADANDLAAIITELDIPGYAGSWFDGEDLILKVGITHPEGQDFIRRLGAEPVMVRWSIEYLHDAFRRLSEQHKSRSGAGASIRRLAINHQKNVIEIGVAPGAASRVVESMVLDVGLDTDLFEVSELNEQAGLSSGTIRGAMGTRNQSFADNTGEDLDKHSCSVGATVVQLSTGRSGYVTAGHCGYQFTEIVSPAGTPIGTTINSDWNWDWWTWGPKDGGWVETAPGWSLLPEIIGDQHGTFSIPAQWSGLQKAVQGTSVCRYGQTSGGGNWSCGTVNARDTQFDASKDNDGSFVLEPAIEVSGSCANDGDSGGPWVAASTHQFQGVTMGARPKNTCPNSATHSYIFPIEVALTDFQLTMLTPHGSSAPDVTSATCPDPVLSNPGQYVCYVNSVDSQGGQAFSWTSDTGHSSNTILLSGNCTSSHLVQVSLETTNPYGTSLDPYSFTCP